MKHTTFTNSFFDTFPEGMMSSLNEVPTDVDAGHMRGYLFTGRDGSQLVFWISDEGSSSSRHVHDFNEYCKIFSGTYTRIHEDGREEVFEAGSEIFFPAGEWHEGRFSKGYRALDWFEKERVKYKEQ